MKRLHASILVGLSVVATAVAVAVVEHARSAPRSRIRLGDLERARRRFVQLTAGARSIEGRLSWGFAFAPYGAAAAVQGGPAAPSKLARDRFKAEAALWRLAEGHDSPEAEGTLGVLLLQRGRVHKGVAALVRAQGVDSYWDVQTAWRL